jgi:dephospho-CoA kinase
MTTSYILWNIFLGALGVSYLMYAKAQKKIVPMIGGILLLVVPYLTQNSYYYILTLVVVVISSYKMRKD